MLRTQDNTPVIPKPNAMTDKIFKKFSNFIHENFGIKLPDSKKVMLEARLQKRLRKLSMKNYEEYFEYVFSREGMEKEIGEMIDVVTTNKTDFFREPAHFDYLVEKALPTVLQSSIYRTRKRVLVWSAGCSSGEEPYTLAMVMNEFSEAIQRINFSVLATDISYQVLQKCIKGIYEMEKIIPVPLDMKKKYLLRSKDPKKKIVKIAPEIRSLIEFRRLNLMDNDFGIKQPVDIIFCRNVIIYFDRPTQEKLLNNFYRYLTPGGFIFMGHSETLNGMNVPLRPVAPTIYRK